MKRIHAVTVTLAVVAIIFIISIFTSIFIFHTVSTDKNSYKLGEKVIIHYSDLGFGQYCTCMGPHLEIYQLQNEKWERVELYPIMTVCVDEMVHISRPMWCDVVMCGTQILNNPTDYQWDMKVYKGEERTCGNQTYTHYAKVDAPLGAYKAKYGMSEAIFYIE